MNKKILILPFLLFFILTTNAQSEFNVNRDIDLVPVFERVVEEGYGTAFIYRELGNEYYFRFNYVKAKEWFEKLFEEKPPTDEILIYRYKQSLKNLWINSEENSNISANGDK